MSETRDLIVQLVVAGRRAGASVELLDAVVLAPGSIVTVIRIICARWIGEDRWDRPNCLDSVETNSSSYLARSSSRISSRIRLPTRQYLSASWVPAPAPNLLLGSLESRFVSIHFDARGGRCSVTEWSYVHEGLDVRHMGPMSQDFHATFSLGDSDAHINTVDASGVTIAAVQGLYEMVQELQEDVDVLRV